MISDKVLRVVMCLLFGFKYIITSDKMLTLPLLAGVAILKSLITLYINICKITFFPSTQFAYIYVSIFICMLCYKDQLGDFTYIYV